jgi:hypothetical protein
MRLLHEEQLRLANAVVYGSFVTASETGAEPTNPLETRKLNVLRGTEEKNAITFRLGSEPVRNPRRGSKSP